MTRLRVSLDSFVEELEVDLDRLIMEHPAGIYMTHLQEEYGESSARIMKACRTLEQKGIIRLQQAASKAYFITPIGHKTDIPLLTLTELQRRLLLYLLLLGSKSKPPTSRIQSNYSQLARIIKCSTGGIHTCINRLSHLGYIRVVQQSTAGQQQPLILEILPKARMELQGIPLPNL